MALGRTRRTNLCDFEKPGLGRGLVGQRTSYLTDEMQTTGSIRPDSYVRNTLAPAALA